MAARQSALHNEYASTCRQAASHAQVTVPCYRCPHCLERVLEARIWSRREGPRNDCMASSRFFLFIGALFRSSLCSRGLSPLLVLDSISKEECARSRRKCRVFSCLSRKLSILRSFLPSMSAVDFFVENLQWKQFLCLADYHGYSVTLTGPSRMSRSLPYTTSFPIPGKALGGLSCRCLQILGTWLGCKLNNC